MFSPQQLSSGALPKKARRLSLCALVCCLSSGLPLIAQETSPETDVAPRTAMLNLMEIKSAFEPLPEPGEAFPEGYLALADLEQIARENNPTLRIASSNATAARGQQVQARLYPNPTIGYSGQQIGDSNTAGQQGGFINQQFITGGKLRLDRAMAGQEYQASQFMFAAQEQRVMCDVRLRFYDTLVAQQQVKLTNQLVQIGQKSADLTKRLLTGLQVSESDALQAEIEWQEAEVLAVNARNRSQEAWRRLATIVGQPTLEERPLAGKLDEDIPHHDWEECYTEVLAQNPELAAARSRVERARIATCRARRQNIPDVDVSTIVFHDNSTKSDAASVQVGFPIPVFNRNQGNILTADAELIGRYKDVERIELVLRDRLAVAYRRYDNARQQTDRYKKEILPRAERSIELITRGYEAGQIDFLILLTTQRTYIRVNLAYLDSLAELRQSATLIDAQLLSESLQGETLTSAPGSVR